MKAARPEKLSSVLKRVVASSRLRDIFKNRDVYRRWAESVGEDIAERTRIAGLKRGRLIVECASQTLAAELAAFRKGELLALMREELGDGIVDDIRFIVGSGIGEREDRAKKSGF